MPRPDESYQLSLFEGAALPAMDWERLVAFRKKLKEQEAAREDATPDETTPSPAGRTPRTGGQARRD